MSQYIMNIDSTYRDRKQYQFSTEFGVIVNPTPGYYSAGNIPFIADSKRGHILNSIAKHFGYQTFIVSEDLNDRQTTRGTIQFIKHISKFCSVSICVNPA